MPFTAQDCRAKALERHRGMAQRWRSLSERLEWVTAQQAARMSGVSWLARTGEPAPGFRPPVNSSSMRTAGDRGAKVGRDGDMRARLKSAITKNTFSAGRRN